MTLIVYPRMYSTFHAGGDDAIVSEGDESIELLYKVYVDRSAHTKSWAFYKNVLQNALRLLVDPETWFTSQLANTALTGYNRQFLLDTLRYIETGTRELPVESWYDLVGESNPRQRTLFAETGARYAAMVLPTASESSLRFLQQWLGRRYGFEDLLLTLHLLFGKPHPQKSSSLYVPRTLGAIAI